VGAPAYLAGPTVCYKKKHITHIGKARPSIDEDITVVANKARIVDEIIWKNSSTPG